MYLRKEHIIALSHHFLRNVLPPGIGERNAQMLFLRFLQEVCGAAKVEHRVINGRIDFRIGGTNPVVLELAVRNETCPNALYGSQNKPELKKLAQVPQTRAKMRYLLLLDNCIENMDVERVWLSYAKQSPHELGIFDANPICVIYVHRKGQNAFSWP